MKNSIQITCILTLFANYFVATDVTMTNLTAGQVTVTLQTTNNSYTQSILPMENPLWNDLDNPTAPTVAISYDGSPITKIVIMRSAANIPPQIIYYDNQYPLNNNQTVGGIAALNQTTQGTLQIWQDDAAINNIKYELFDLSSYLIRCQTLQNNLTVANIDTTEQQLQDVSNSLKSVQSLDKNGKALGQIVTIQSRIDIINNIITMMRALQKDLDKIETLQKNLSLLTLSETEDDLKNLQFELQGFLQNSSSSEILTTQLQKLQNSLQALQTSVTQFKNSQHNFGTAGSVVMQ